MDVFTEVTGDPFGGLTVDLGAEAGLSPVPATPAHPSAPHPSRTPP